MQDEEIEGEVTCPKCGELLLPAAASDGLFLYCPSCRASIPLPDPYPNYIERAFFLRGLGPPPELARFVRQKAYRGRQ